MKRSALLRQLRRHGCHLKREGRSHSLWTNPQTGKVSGEDVNRLRYLAGTVATADFPPNDQQGEVHAVLRERLEETRRAWTALLQNELPAFNRMLQQRNLPRLISDQP